MRERRFAYASFYTFMFVTMWIGFLFEKGITIFFLFKLEGLGILYMR